MKFKELKLVLAKLQSKLVSQLSLVVSRGTHCPTERRTIGACRGIKEGWFRFPAGRCTALQKLP